MDRLRRRMIATAILVFMVGIGVAMVGVNSYRQGHAIANDYEKVSDSAGGGITKIDGGIVVQVEPLGLATRIDAATGEKTAIHASGGYSAMGDPLVSGDQFIGMDFFGYKKILDSKRQSEEVQSLPRLLIPMIWHDGKIFGLNASSTEIAWMNSTTGSGATLHAVPNQQVWHDISTSGGNFGQIVGAFEDRLVVYYQPDDSSVNEALYVIDMESGEILDDWLPPGMTIESRIGPEYDLAIRRGFDMDGQYAYLGMCDGNVCVIQIVSLSTGDVVDEYDLPVPPGQRIIDLDVESQQFAAVTLNMVEGSTSIVWGKLGDVQHHVSPNGKQPYLHVAIVDGEIFFSRGLHVYKGIPGTGVEIAPFLFALGVMFMVGGAAFPFGWKQWLERGSVGGTKRCLNCGRKRTLEEFCSYCGWRTADEEAATNLAERAWEHDR